MKTGDKVQLTGSWTVGFSDDSEFLQIVRDARVLNVHCDDIEVIKPKCELIMDLIRTSLDEQEQRQFAEMVASEKFMRKFQP